MRKSLEFLHFSWFVFTYFIYLTCFEKMLFLKRLHFCYFQQIISCAEDFLVEKSDFGLLAYPLQRGCHNERYFLGKLVFWKRFLGSYL